MTLPLAFLSTYPPRRCGIATFTQDLRGAMGGGRIVELRRTEDEPRRLPEVGWTIEQDSPTDYRRVAGDLVAAGVRAVSVQHEYGIFGGPDGARVLDFVEALDLPAVATLHTVLPRPTPGQRAVLARLAGQAAATVVMSSGAATLLETEYDADPARIRVVPHGVRDLPLRDPDDGKAALGLRGRTVLLSFGLLGPGKGYEHLIDALPALRRADPTVIYVILGATHPDLVRREGEAYREGLAARAAEHGVAELVRFEDRYVDGAELDRWLLAADIYVTPYPNMDQATSGTLAYAVGAGKAVVSTPYAHARELLAMDRGVLVEPCSGEALAAGIAPLLRDPARRRELGRRAWRHGRSMTWAAVGERYRGIVSEVVRETAREAGRARRPGLASAVRRAGQAIALRDAGRDARRAARLIGEMDGRLGRSPAGARG